MAGIVSVPPTPADTAQRLVHMEVFITGADGQMQRRSEPVPHLCDRICTFLVSCGEPYTKINSDLQMAVLDGLASGQYVIKEQGGEIVFFASFWRLRQGDLDHVRRFERPANIVTGPFLYIVEAGSCPRASPEMMRAIRNMNFDATHMVAHRRGRWRQITLQKGETV